MKQIRYLKDKINRKAANCCLMLMAMVLAVTNTWAQASPSQPTNLVATPSNGGGSIAFTAGSSNGGGAISNYQYSTNNGVSWEAFSPAVTTSPVVITGLTNGTEYQVKLRAVNSLGAGTASSAVSLTPAIISVGNDYGGGKVGYILQPSDPGYDPTKIKGLIISTADYNPKAWAIGSYTAAATGVVNTAFGTGAANTAALVNLMGPGDYIAYEFDTLTLGGYTDWYLPSQEEIARILPNYAILNIGSNQVGPGRQTFWYASSTESADDKFNRVYFFTFTSATAISVQTKAGPGGSGPSRPVRNFEISLCTPTTSTTTITNCGAYTWNGQTYDSTGTYTWTGTNAAGCDSTATLNLTISKPAGSDWTIQTVANPNYIYNNSITYGNGLFVVVKEDGGTNGVMTSTDGINWTQQTTPDATWEWSFCCSCIFY